MRKILLLVPLFALIITGCSVGQTQPDQEGLHYHGGPLSATTFANCIGPSQRKYDGPSDPHYYYPAGQRTYDFTGGEGSESGPITVVSKDNQELKVAGVAKFYLDTSCKTLRKFHEQIGLKFHAYMNGDSTSAGWNQMLNVYIGQQLRNAMIQVAQQYNWLDLYNNNATRVAWEQQVKQATPGLVTSFAGDDYFQNFSFTIQKPEPDPKLVDALAQVQQAVIQRQAVENQNATVLTELQQIRELRDVLGPYGYILYRALRDCEQGKQGCPQFLPVPGGTNINVVPK